MAITVVNADVPTGLIVYTSTDLDENKEGIVSASNMVHMISVDNSSNGAISYVKMWNIASGSVTVGTTAPDAILCIPASTRLEIPIPQGWSFPTALTIAAVTTAGDAGTTGPTSAVTIRIAYV